MCRSLLAVAPVFIIIVGAFAQVSSKPAVRRLRAQRALKVDRFQGADPAAVSNLKQKHIAAKVARGKLVGSVNSAINRLSTADKIKHGIAVRQVRLRAAQAEQHLLKAKENQIDQVHNRLVSSLRNDLDPKIEAARASFKKKQAELQVEADAVRYWKGHIAEVKMGASEMMQDLRATRHQLEDLHKQVLWARQQEEMDNEKYQYSKQMASREIQSMQYTREQYKSELDHLKALQDKVKEVKLKVGAAQDLRSMEEVEDARRDEWEAEDDAHLWKDNHDYLRPKVLEMIKDNKTSYDALVEAQSQELWLEGQDRQVEKQYKLKEKRAADELRTLKTVVAKYKAELDKFKLTEAAIKSAAEKIKHLEAIRAVEESKVHLSHAQRSGRILKKMKKWEAASNATAHELTDLESQYASWQVAQQQAIQEVVADKRNSRDASQAFEAGMHHVFATAQKNHYQDEVASSPTAWGGAWAHEDEPK